MKRFFNRKRLAMSFSVLGILLMGVDLMLTRNFFTHIGELMAASILCFVIGIVLDRQSAAKPSRAEAGSPAPTPAGRAQSARVR